MYCSGTPVFLSGTGGAGDAGGEHVVDVFLVEAGFGRALRAADERERAAGDVVQHAGGRQPSRSRRAFAWWCRFRRSRILDGWVRRTGAWSMAAQAAASSAGGWAFFWREGSVEVASVLALALVAGWRRGADVELCGSSRWWFGRGRRL